MLRDRTEQKKLERMRTDFIANASHELRTPLTSMSGFIETLQGHARDDPRARDRFLEIMGQQTERMLRLVEDLIGLSAIELKEAKPPEDRIDLGGVAESVRDMMLPVVGREGGRLTFERPDTPLEMTADRHEVFRLIQNLCDNAVKYGTPEDGSGAEVHLSVGRGQAPTLEGATRSGETIEHLAVRAGIAKEELLWVRVADRGEGIDVNDLPRLTERFYRVNPQISREKGGTGLGLAIVKHIIQRHRGALQIETVAGEGAAFTCYFPPHISAIRQKKVAADRK
jgi:two-component system phosphate regulon sensor histidine kinase PhoR